MDFAHPRRPKIEMWFGAVLTFPKDSKRMEGLRPWFTDFCPEGQVPPKMIHIWSLIWCWHESLSDQAESGCKNTCCFCCRVEKEQAVGWAWWVRDVRMLYKVLGLRHQRGAVSSALRNSCCRPKGPFLEGFAKCQIMNWHGQLKPWYPIESILRSNA